MTTAGLVICLMRKNKSKYMLVINCHLIINDVMYYMIIISIIIYELIKGGGINNPHIIPNMKTL